MYKNLNKKYMIGCDSSRGKEELLWSDDLNVVWIIPDDADGIAEGKRDRVSHICTIYQIVVYYEDISLSSKNKGFFETKDNSFIWGQPFKI